MRGRPPKDNAKDYTLRVRMDKETLAKLDDICEMMDLTRSEAVRRAIEELRKKKKKIGE